MEKNINIPVIAHHQQQYENKIIALFPKKPYETQINIAKSLYQILKQGKIDVAIVESPTGTGKTYSLLVGVLAWLAQNPSSLSRGQTKGKLKLEQQMQNKQDESNSLPSWLAAKTTQNKLSRALNQKSQKMKKLKTIKEFKQSNKNRHKQNKKDTKDSLSWEVQDIQDLGDNRNEDQVGVKRLNRNPNIEQILSDECLPKVIFVSRTHSQLGQVMDSITGLPMQWKYISMASKDHLCVHPNIEKTKVHEKCQYLLSHGGCPYYHQQPISDFLGLRVEQAQKLGQENSICSYFSIKNLLPVSDIICLPYSSILNSQIRTRLGINLTNSIVVFDEAHNIIEQQLSLKSPQLSFKELYQFNKRVEQYKNKYGTRMMEANVHLLGHLQDILLALMTIMKEEYEKMKKKVREQDQSNYVKMTKIELFCRLKLSEIRVSKIKNYISLSNFDQKLVHFNSKQPFSLNIINCFLDFITILTTNAIKSRTTAISQPVPESTLVLIKNLPTESVKSDIHETLIKIFCMESTQLGQIIAGSRLVVLAGGTMEPINSFTNIFNSNNQSYQLIKGEHVIKDQQCNVYCIGGISNKCKDMRLKLTFTYNQMKQHGKTIIENACRIVTEIIKKTQKNAGTVIFIQNYGLLDSLANCLGESIGTIPIFYDCNTQAFKTKQNKNGNLSVFQKYQNAIKQKRISAVLVSVMGGRLSEGINFSDELARSIIVLGLPYPNLKSPEMVEKMKYLDSKLKHKFNSKPGNFPSFESGKKLKKQNDGSDLEQTGQSYYENCCIRTINQTIGRGIRHINDYSNIYLIDSRFAGIGHRLPSWMSRRVKYIDFYDCE